MDSNDSLHKRRRELQKTTRIVFKHILRLPAQQANYGGRVTDVHDSWSPSELRQCGPCFSVPRIPLHFFSFNLCPQRDWLKVWCHCQLCFLRAMHQFPSLGLLLPRDFKDDYKFSVLLAKCSSLSSCLVESRVLRIEQ